MSSALTELQTQLNDSLQLIDTKKLSSAGIVSNDLLSQGIDNKLSVASASLLEKCEQVTKQFYSDKPKLRIIHHFACSGGTLVSKCLSAMPNVFLLSEVHPHSYLQSNKESPQYSPSDFAKLAIYADVPEHNVLAEKIFVNSVKTSYQHILERGGTLILRDHTHSDYSCGKNVCNNTVVELLKDDFDIISLVTLRNPIDSYLSLVTNGWVHFQPATFNEYCARLLSFLSHFKKSQIVLYEQIVDAPTSTVNEICHILEIPFDDTFDSIFDVFSVTGGSGRKTGGVIKPRKRRDISCEIKKQIEMSSNFQVITNKFPCYKLGH